MENIHLKNGLILGAVLVVVGTILHAIDPRVFLNWSSWVGYVLMIYFMYKTAVEVRNREGGVLPFGDAFIAALIPMVIGAFFISAYTYALHNWINPELTEVVKEIAMESTAMVMEKMSEMFDMDMDEVDIQKELEKVDYGFGFGKMILSWVLTSLMGCVPALIVAAITKRGE